MNDDEGIKSKRSKQIEKSRQYLFARRGAYQKIFLNPVGQEVLADLARFCRAHTSSMSPDPYMTAMLEGRREVFLRIQHQLNLTNEDLWKLYGDDQRRRG